MLIFIQNSAWALIDRHITGCAGLTHVHVQPSSSSTIPMMLPRFTGNMKRIWFRMLAAHLFGASAKKLRIVGSAVEMTSANLTTGDGMRLPSRVAPTENLCD